MRTRNQDKSTPTAAGAEQNRRTSRKRRASSQLSDAPIPQSSSSTQTSSQQIKRRKRTDASHDHPEDLRIVDEEEHVAVSTPAASASRHVHFSQSAANQGQKATSTHLTPHVRKHMVVDRRQTLSPATLDRISTPKNKSRLSLPSSFSLSPDSPAAKNFRPLSQVIKERVKSRLRRSRLSEEIKEQKDGAETHQELIQLRQEIGELEDSIRQLLHKLDVQQQLGEDADDQKVDKIQAELAELREQLAEKKEHESALPDLDAQDHVDVIDEDMMIFDSSQDVFYPQLPSDNDVFTVNKAVDTIEVSNAQTQVAFPDSNHEEERRQFRDAIGYWTREASDAKAALEILTIELQSLGFAGDSTDAVLSSIRDSFASVRERLEQAVPGQVPSDITNSDLIDLVADHLEALADKVIQQEDFVKQGDGLREELVREINGLVERLSQAEIRKRTLEIGFNELDEQSQKDEVLIDQLDKQLKKIEDNHDKAQALITEKQAKLNTLDHENKELESNIDKLGRALEKYRESEAKLQDTIMRLENEHKAQLSKVKKEKKAAVSNLEDQLKTESTKRATAEADADDKQVTITNLERRAEMDEANLDTLKQQLAALQEEKAAEQQAKESAEGERDEKTSYIADLEVKVEQAEADLDDLKNELGRLRELNEAEQRQREAAENDLDARIKDIEKLENKLNNKGKEANELRTKIFGLQQRHEKDVQDLNDAAQAREEQYQSDMAAEVSRREDSDATAAHRNVVIAELTEALRNLEEAMKLQLEERDEKITELAARVDQLQSELDQTQKELDTALNDLENVQAVSEAKINQLASDIAALQGTVAEQEAAIKTLNAQALTTAKTHAIAVAERDEKIGELNHDIYNAQTQLQALETEKASLERRVEAEAEAMLELQADKDEAIASLKDTIRAKQGEIEDLGRKAQEVDRSWAAVLNARDTEIGELRATGDENNATIARLSKLNATLKDKFRKYVRDSTATAAAMKDDMEQALLTASTKSGELREEGRRVLEEVEALDAVGDMAGPSTLENPRVKHIKQRRSRRQYDSGIGVEEESLLIEEN